jgi:glycosyltransferase involved in cell wall biosynthesis
VTVVVAGHFPPPVHGMAVAVGAFADVVERTRPVVRLDLSPGQASSRRRHHARRLARVALALGRLVRIRPRSRTLYLGCDAGLGMTYTAALLAVGRILGYRCFVHHHSFAYVNRRSPLMAVLVRVGGRGCHHLVLCEGMAEQFAARYPRAERVELLPCAFAVEDRSGPAAEPDAPRGEGAVVLGHLSNLSVEKGLDAVFATLAEVRDRGVPARLVLAGPTAGPGDAAVLDEHLAAQPQSSWLGPVDVEAKDRFFASLDLFLLPSSYVHEAAPLVVLEALAHGVPVMAYGRGCLPSMSVEDAFVVDPGADFARAAAAVVADRFGGGRRDASLPTLSRQRYEALRAESESAVDRVLAEFGEPVTAGHRG